MFYLCISLLPHRSHHGSYGCLLPDDDNEPTYSHSQCRQRRPSGSLSYSDCHRTHVKHTRLHTNIIKHYDSTQHYITIMVLGYNGVGYNGVGYNGVGYNGVGYNGAGYNGVGTHIHCSRVACTLQQLPCSPTGHRTLSPTVLPDTPPLVHRGESDHQPDVRQSHCTRVLSIHTYMHYNLNNYHMYMM